MALKHAAEVFRVVLNHPEDAFDRVARDAFFDVEPIGFIVFEEDVGFVHATEKVVQIAHDVLVGTDHEGPNIVGFSGFEWV